MAKIKFEGNLPLPKKENRLRQGDFVFCKAVSGANDFWGIVDSGLGVIAINGASNEYIQGSDLYLNETYSYWTIIKRIPCEKVELTIKELD